MAIKMAVMGVVLSGQAALSALYRFSFDLLQVSVGSVFGHWWGPLSKQLRSGHQLRTSEKRRWCMSMRYIQSHTCVLQEASLLRYTTNETRILSSPLSVSFASKVADDVRVAPRVGVGSLGRLGCK